MIGSNLNLRVLFTRANVDSISERCTTYIVQRRMDPGDAWRQAVEDEAQLIEHKLELMEEGALVWDGPSLQLKAMRQALSPVSEKWAGEDTEEIICQTESEDMR